MADLSLRHANGASKNLQHEAAPWIERLARFGYAAKGVVYALVGVIAVQAAFSRSEQAEDSKGALWSIFTKPLGRWMLAVVALGLIGYVVWRFVAAALDPEGKGSEAKGIAQRVGYAISGVLYGALAWEAIQIVTGSAGGGGGETGAEHWTAVAMSKPLGVWMVGLVGLGIIAFGIYELYKAYASDLSKRLDLSEMSSAAREWVVRMARLGLAARGVIFGLLGLLLTRAALHYNPQEAAGLGEALRAMERQPYGRWLLGVVGMGMVAYGLFEIVKARYRRIRPE